MSVKSRWMSILVLGLVPVSGVQATDVTGARRAEFDTRIGVQKYTHTLTQDGDKVTGKTNWRHRLRRTVQIVLLESPPS